MARVQQVFWLILAILSTLWWASDATDWSALQGVFAWRTVLMQYSGVLGIGVMSVAMVLALRPRWVEPQLGGLDKMYRLHKWLGIAGLVIAVTHWLLAEAPKWLVGLGLLQRPARGPRPPLADGAIVESFLRSQRGLAEGIGEWAFYAVVLLIVLALVKRFPYRRFVQTHRLIALAYLALVWHTVVLLKFDAWRSPLGLVMAALMAAGSVGAVLVLSGRRGARRQVAGRVAGLRRHPALKVVEIDIHCSGAWAGHQPGQFAFVTLHADEGPHPYTLSSAWRGDGHLTIIVKALGDYTDTLAERVQVGDTVQLEGPYGRFTFEGAPRRQIWVGGGIGITPFIARLQALAARPDGRTIDLFHTTAVVDPEAIGLLERDARQAAVKLHVLRDAQDGRLDAARITQTVPQWRDADVWFCGPPAFGRALKKGLTALGLPEGRFHQEMFEMR